MKASNLLEKYFKSVYEASHLTWSDENKCEVKQIVQLIIDATKEDIKNEQMTDLIQRGG
ncbi:MAG: hypothetical protein HQL29_06420 [Candidatus Omnitrophica bacterium]|nr:hypothetical protein [Candidatus Omnitrophota bacterium]